jgi:hypothetical protein
MAMSNSTPAARFPQADLAVKAFCEEKVTTFISAPWIMCPG